MRVRSIPSEVSEESRSVWTRTQVYLRKTKLHRQVPRVYIVKVYIGVMMSQWSDTIS